MISGILACRFDGNSGKYWPDAPDDKIRNECIYELNGNAIRKTRPFDVRIFFIHVIHSNGINDDSQCDCMGPFCGLINMRMAQS